MAFAAKRWLKRAIAEPCGAAANLRLWMVGGEPEALRPPIADRLRTAQFAASTQRSTAMALANLGNGLVIVALAINGPQMGAALITETMERRPDIGFASYDRFFPNQDTMPIGGFGNLLGGALSDWRPNAFLVGALLALMASLAVLYFAEPYAVPAIAMILIWGAIQFGAGAPLQSRIVDQASEAPNLASTLNQGAFNFGNATGASLGGVLISAGLSYRILPIASIGVTLVTLVLALFSIRLDRRQARRLAVQAA